MENLNRIINFIKTKKYDYIKILDITNISIISDFFIILSLPNLRSIDSLLDDIIELCNKYNIEIKNIEGKTTGWIIIDLYDIVIHLFTEDDRKYFNLEKIWIDAKEIKIED